MLFIATADAEGRPQCSYKGGEPGFVRVLDERTVAFPNYDGNGMYLTAGNALVNPHVGLLFLDFEQRKRLRLNGIASHSDDDPLLAEYPEAQFLWRVEATEVFPNCPRYIHHYRLVERSRFVPRAECPTPVPAWKTRDWAKRRAARRRPGPRAGRRRARALVVSCGQFSVSDTAAKPGVFATRRFPPAGAGRARAVVRARRPRLRVAADARRTARPRGRARRVDDDADRPHRRRTARRGRPAVCGSSPTSRSGSTTSTSPRAPVAASSSRTRPTCSRRRPPS